jgi:hypothetical protein
LACDSAAISGCGYGDFISLFRRLTIGVFSRWFAIAAVSDSICYAKGFLAAQLWETATA